jgi:predicted nucleic acid-binding Zn ribbon protein
MDKIDGPLKDLLTRLRLDEPLLGWQAVGLWDEVVGERVAARARATSFREGTLYVSVENAVWMTELSYLRRQMAEELNRRLGAEVVREIRFQPPRERASNDSRTRGV